MVYQVSPVRTSSAWTRTHKNNNVLFTRDGKTAVPASAVWSGRALMCSCRGSRASHVVVSFDSLPLAQTTELGALCSDRGFGEVSEFFSKGPPALGSACRPRVSAPPRPSGLFAPRPKGCTGLAHLYGAAAARGSSAPETALCITGARPTRRVWCGRHSS
jgi:hypothetical protein